MTTDGMLRTAATRSASAAPALSATPPLSKAPSTAERPTASGHLGTVSFVSTGGTWRPPLASSSHAAALSVIENAIAPSPSVPSSPAASILNEGPACSRLVSTNAAVWCPSCSAARSTVRLGVVVGTVGCTSGWAPIGGATAFHANVERRSI